MKKSQRKDSDQEMLDRAIAEEAIAESTAQLEILRVLAPLDNDRRRRVMNAALHLIEADLLVEGVMEAFLASKDVPTKEPPK